MRNNLKLQYRIWWWADFSYR